MKKNHLQKQNSLYCHVPKLYTKLGARPTYTEAIRDLFIKKDNMHWTIALGGIMGYSKYKWNKCWIFITLYSKVLS